MEKEEKRDRHDIRWGKELQRLHRLANRSGRSPGEIARQSLIDYELAQSEFSDTVRDAILALFRTLIPDEQYDPVDDTRQEQAIQVLGDLLHSHFAAQGIAEAFTLLFTENMLEMSSLRFPSVENFGTFSDNFARRPDTDPTIGPDTSQ